MINTVTLLHDRFKGDRVVTFYDGLLVSKEGLLTIPANRPSWIQTAFRRGWNNTPDGVRIWGTNQLSKEVDKQLSQSMTAESAKEDNDVPVETKQPVIVAEAAPKSRRTKQVTE